MEVIITPNAEEGALTAARILDHVVRSKPAAVLGLATGSTPLGLYRELARRHREEGLDFGEITSFNLDEYIGLEPTHPASYHRFMKENLFDHINIDPARTHIPDGMASDVTAFSRQYEKKISDVGGIDLQVLGIGNDGHIGFNEPSSSLASRTRLKTLTQVTIEANKRFFNHIDEVPRHTITMGVGTIMEARICLLLAFGEAKADAVQAMVEGPITASCPASVLQMHPRVTVVVDEAAAGKLSRADYYRYVYETKPASQVDRTFLSALLEE